MSRLARLATTGGDKNYIEDVFQTWLYTGNGSTQTINNGIDLAGKGGMVWIKDRAISSTQALFDTTSGATKYVQAQSSTSQNTDATTLTSFNLNGFSLGSNGNVNSSSSPVVSWTFRKQPKFFTVVSWTGNGSNRAINHDLGAVPGCILIKCTSNVGTNWAVYHRSLANTEYLTLNTTDAKATNATYWNSTTPTDTQFFLGTSGLVNQNTFTYVAYLFAHDAGGFGASGTDNVISCGYAASGTTVNLGWEPQWILIKDPTQVDSWRVFDSMRGILPANISTSPTLAPNSSAAEANSTGYVGLTSTGFYSGTNNIYIAIRRPNKPPTTGTQVFAPVTYTGSGAARTINAGVLTDLTFIKGRNSGYSFLWFDRLRGPTTLLDSSSANAETSALNTVTGFDDQTGVKLGTDSGGFGVNISSLPELAYFLRRASGFFDVVCYGGEGNPTGTNLKNHNLGAVPELIFVKNRSGAFNWIVWCAYSLGSFDALNKQFLQLNTTVAGAQSNYWSYNGNPQITSSVFSLGSTYDETNATGSNYVAYLFASIPGISKVGSYTGNGGTVNTNGTAQTINCGFAAGARFVLIKRTDSTGNWFVFDSARGIVAASDPYVLLNSTAAEVTTVDAVDPDNSGFIVNQTSGTNLNVTSASYIYLAIA